MTDLEKYAYIQCNQCRTDNRLQIDIQKTGHYQCGQCKSYLMFYGIEKQSKYKNWIWALIIAAPIAFIGYQNYPNENEWTKKRCKILKKPVSLDRLKQQLGHQVKSKVIVNV